MKNEIGLQFSLVVKRVVRAAAWVAVTMTLGLMLAMLFGGPLVASPPTGHTSPGKHDIKKTGPWAYKPASTPV